MHGVTQCRNCGKALPRDQFEGRDHVLKFPPLLRDEHGRIVLILWRVCAQCSSGLGRETESAESTPASTPPAEPAAPRPS